MGKSSWEKIAGYIDTALGAAKAVAGTVSPTQQRVDADRHGRADIAGMRDYLRTGDGGMLNQPPTNPTWMQRHLGEQVNEFRNTSSTPWRGGEPWDFIDRPGETAEQIEARVIRDMAKGTETAEQIEARVMAGEKSFGEVFDASRDEGLKEFSWKGGSYHTKTAEEVALEEASLLEGLLPASEPPMPPGANLPGDLAGPPVLPGANLPGDLAGPPTPADMLVPERAVREEPFRLTEQTSTFIQEREKLVQTAYKDADKVAVCWGSTGRVSLGTVVNLPTCKRYLEEDLAVVYKAMNKHIRIPLTRNQQTAVASLVFNVGDGAKGFGQSEALKLLNAGDHEGFMREAFSAEAGWVNSRRAEILGNEAGNLVLDPGLVKRRQLEQTLYETPDPDAFLASR